MEIRAALDTGPRKGTKFKDPGRATDSPVSRNSARRETPARTPRHPDHNQFLCGLETTQANQEFGKIHSPADQAEDEEA